MSKPSKSDCAGCYNNFYNGHNDLGVETCWSLKDATVIHKRLVPLNMRPPWDSIPLRKLPSCYHTTGYAAVSTGPKP